MAVRFSLNMSVVSSLNKLRTYFKSNLTAATINKIAVALRISFWENNRFFKKLPTIAPKRTESNSHKYDFSILKPLVRILVARPTKELIQMYILHRLGIYKSAIGRYR